MSYYYDGDNNEDEIGEMIKGKTMENNDNKTVKLRR